MEGGLEVGQRFNIKLSGKKDENRKHASELVSLWFLWQEKKQIKNDCDFVGNLKYFLSLEKLFTCLSQVNTVAALSETDS